MSGSDLLSGNKSENVSLDSTVQDYQSTNSSAVDNSRHLPHDPENIAILRSRGRRRSSFFSPSPAPPSPSKYSN